MSGNPELRVSHVGQDSNAPVTRGDIQELRHVVSDHETELNDKERGRYLKALEDIDSLKHTRTGQTAILGFITYLLGVITAFAAIWALKP